MTEIRYTPTDCVICAQADIHTAGTTEIIRDCDRDGLGTAHVYACDECIAAGTAEDREHMGITAVEWEAIRARLLTHEDDAMYTCPQCGVSMLAWQQDDHQCAGRA